VSTVATKTRHGRHGPARAWVHPARRDDWRLWACNRDQRTVQTMQRSPQPPVSPAIRGASAAANAVTSRPANLFRAVHTTLAWLPVRAVDHTQVTGTCVSCHNGGHCDGQALAPPWPRAPVAASCHTPTPGRRRALITARSRAYLHHLPQRRAGHRHAAHPHSDHPAVRCPCHGTLAWKPARIDHQPLPAAAHPATTQQRGRPVDPGI